MDFKNWFLLFIIIGTAGFAGYTIYNNPTVPLQSSTTFSENPSPTAVVAGESFSVPEDWEVYDGETIKFNYPPEWQPEEKQPFGGSVVEDVTLNIPEATDNSVFYSVIKYDTVRPDDIISERTFDVENRTWTEWVRKGEGYVSYDYFTNGNVGADAESFGIHVTLAEEDEEIKEKLIDFLSTIEFEIEELTPKLTITPSPSPTPTSTASADLLE